MMQSPDHSSNIVFYEAPEKEDSPCKTGGFSIFTLINFAIAAVNVANNILNNNNNNNNNNNDRNNNDNNVNVADNNNNGNNLNMIDLGGALGRRRRLLVEHPGDLGAIQDSLQEDGLVLEVVGVHTPSGANNSAAAPNSASGRYKRDTLLNAWRAARSSDVPEVPDQLALLLRLTSDQLALPLRLTSDQLALLLRLTSDQLALLLRLTSEVSASLPVQHAILMKHVMLLTLDLWEDFSSDELMSANQKMELKNCLLRERPGKSPG
ncbi:transcription initiation factor TFIID subunit 1-like [Amphibalanus amphitrite]|uniref:transcription initiation factor TFIID subunit 1-like n=1 Tax=Amphibalanus amphitrite TaxID=1232801 RepID=UPI001C90CFD8|nr:transcription initiation factor TFIID subunit 1-like [Amphibalanus amphitrite]